jgi:hypothetical protein
VIGAATYAETCPRNDAWVIKLPWTVIKAAEAFRRDTSALRPLSGNSGSSWDAGDRVLRFGPRVRMDTELAAAAAAAREVPVARIIAQADVGGDSVVLIENCPLPAGREGERTPCEGPPR